MQHKDRGDRFQVVGGLGRIRGISLVSSVDPVIHMWITGPGAWLPFYILKVKISIGATQDLEIIPAKNVNAIFLIK